MKKLNLFKKNKLWLASLGLATTSSLVLAACASQTQTPNNNGGSQNGGNQTENPGTQNPTEPVVPPAPEMKKPTEQQLKLANAVLDNVVVKNSWTATIKDDQKTIESLLTKVTAIDELNKKTVEESIKTLGVATAAAAEAADSSVFALIKSLEDGVSKATDDKVAAETKTAFNDVVVQVRNSATALLASLQALPETTAAKQLEDLQGKFTTALKAFVENKAEANAATTLTALRTAKNAYKAEVKKVAQKLIDAEQAGFVLDSATSALANYANTKLATFLSNESSRYSKVLNNLVTQVRSNVLGTLGADLWTAGNIDKTVADRNRPSGIQDSVVSTQLYKIVVGLADQDASWKTISQTLKKLTFKQSALTKVQDAVELLALHVEASVPVDVARLNAYLVTPTANVVQLLQASTTNVAHILEDVANSVSNYQKYLVAPASGSAKLVSDLEALSAAVGQETGKDTQKTNIDNFNAQVKTLVTKFAEFKTEWDKVNSSFAVTAESTTIYPLLNQADQLNQMIGVSKNYGDVVQVAGKVNGLKTLITQIDAAVKSATPKSALMTALDALIDLVKDGSAFKTNLTSFTSVTDLNEANKKSLEEIAKSSDSTGYLYTSGIAKNQARAANKPASLDFSNLKTELIKLQNADSKQLKTVFDLLSNQLQPNQGSQTFEMTHHLADLFNNGEVQADPENH
ncbi:hypothetical protein J2Z62_000443 [Mycoplasmoides fastidiosum]|uniref:Lipoprotein n=1 Tax=Mycoplasmoides fastidiosum TaxID=92758 RepID=A0ABU0LZJ0_9BACT|nr:hypothetical protein [Mycoplasmoides fastidiosum]MDQ0514005.1 hypothetical protein [Mycoplasmoides fastidiosum]UUD37582.1 hypothetical protein NPA10_03375 [Mycoplasmoides fastidiosum]